MVHIRKGDGAVFRKYEGAVTGAWLELCIESLLKNFTVSQTEHRMKLLNLQAYKIIAVYPRKPCDPVTELNYSNECLQLIQTLKTFKTLP
jgi:hypothetical protein